MLYYDFDKMCRGEIFDESGSGNNGISRGRVIVEAGYNQDNGVDLSDGFIQLDGMNFKVWWGMLRVFLTTLSRYAGVMVITYVSESSGLGSSPDNGQDTLLSQYLSPPRCIKWLPVNLILGEGGGNLKMD